MRIEGYIEHPDMIITVFKNEDKYSVKFSVSAGYEQTFKLRTGGTIQNIEDVKKWASPALQHTVLQHFQFMHKTSMQSFKDIESSAEEEFEKII